MILSKSTWSSLIKEVATLQSLGQGDLLARISESVGPLSILGKKPIAEILENILKGSSIDTSLIKELHFDLDKIKKMVLSDEIEVDSEDE